MQFQSTLPWRERLLLIVVCNVSEAVSIHAPMKGATRHRHIWITHQKGFNPRSHEGSDYYGPVLCSCFWGFNPRSHEGSDGWYNGRPLHILRFNPRSHEGSDDKERYNGIFWHKFQSTLPWRERRYFKTPTLCRYGFQSTLPWRERLTASRQDIRYLCFNPRSHEGSDLIPTYPFRLYGSFNPRSHEGSDW